MRDSSNKPLETSLSFKGMVIFVISMVAAAAGAYLAVTRGVHVPWTSIVFHNVIVTLILGLLPGVVVFLLLTVLVVICGGNVFKP